MYRPTALVFGSRTETGITTQTDACSKLCFVSHGKWVLGLDFNAHSIQLDKCRLFMCQILAQAVLCVFPIPHRHGRWHATLPVVPKPTPPRTITNTP